MFLHGVKTLIAIVSWQFIVDSCITVVYSIALDIKFYPILIYTTISAWPLPAHIIYLHFIIVWPPLSKADII